MVDLATIGYEVQTAGIRAGIDELKKLRTAGEDVERSSDAVDRGSRRAAGGVAAAGGAMRDAQGRFTAGARSTGAISTNMGAAAVASAGLSKGLGGVAGILAGGVGLGALSAFASDAVQTFRDFEKMVTSLETVMGSAQTAAEAVSDISKFASETPFDLSQSIDAFKKLTTLGLDPSLAALESYGNTASAMGKDLNQMIEAVADASVGEFERLKEFGIKAKSQGDEVAFTFQGVTTTVQKNAEEITGYLQSIGDVQFAGAMKDQMDTLDGAFSNFGDSYDRLKRVIIGEGGLDGALKSALQFVSEDLNETSDRIEEIGDRWEGLTFTEKVLDIDDVWLEGATKKAETFVDWWEGVDLTPWSTEIVVPSPDDVRNQFDPVIDEVEDAGEQTGDAYATGLQSTLNQIIANSEALGDESVEAVAAAVPAMQRVGKDAGTGLAIGIDQGAQVASDASRQMGEDAVKATAEAVGQNSPWRSMIDIGVDAGPGLGIGIERGAADAVGAARTMSGDVVLAFSDQTEGAIDAGTLMGTGFGDGVADAVEEKIPTVRIAADTMGQEMERGIARALQDADSVEDAMDNIGDFLEDWLTEQIAKFAARKIVAYFDTAGLGDAYSAVAAYFSDTATQAAASSAAQAGTSAAASAGTTAATNAATAAGGGAASGAAAGAGTGALAIAGYAAIQAAAIYAIYSIVDKNNGNATGAAAGYAVGGILGGVVGGAIGGDYRDGDRGIRVGMDGTGGTQVSGYRERERQRSLYQGTQTREYDDAISARLQSSISSTFQSIETSIENTFGQLGVNGSQALLDGFAFDEVKISGENFAEGLTELLATTTKDMYVAAIGQANPRIQELLVTQIGDVGAATVEEIEAGMSDALTITNVVGAGFAALGVEMGSADFYVSRLNNAFAGLNTSLTVNDQSALALTEAFGGVDRAAEAFSNIMLNLAPSWVQADVAVSQLTGQLSVFDQAVLEQGGSLVRGTDQLYEYIVSQDATTEAGRRNIVMAEAQIDTMAQLQAVTEQNKASMDAVVGSFIQVGVQVNASGEGTQQFANRLIELAGGMEAFAASMDTYYNTFYSEEERKAQAMAEAVAQVQAFNDGLGLSGDAAIDSAGEFRAHTDALLAAAAAGDVAAEAEVARALQVQGAMAMLAESGLSLEDAVQESLTSTGENFQFMVDNATQALDEIALSSDAFADIANKTEAATVALDLTSGSIVTVSDSAVQLTGSLGEASNAQLKLSEDAATAAGASAAMGDQLQSVSGQVQAFSGSAATAAGSANSAASATSNFASAAASAANAFESASGKIRSASNEAVSAAAKASQIPTNTQGFATGLDRVTVPVLSTNIHMDEAVLRADVARQYRALGGTATRLPDFVANAPIRTATQLRTVGGGDGELAAQMRQLRTEMRQQRERAARAEERHAQLLGRIAAESAGSRRLLESVEQSNDRIERKTGT